MELMLRLHLAVVQVLSAAKDTGRDHLGAITADNTVRILYSSGPSPIERDRTDCPGMYTWTLSGLDQRTTVWGYTKSL